jgi:alpha-tubulin suppressor-like RCC1 family protein
MDSQKAGFWSWGYNGYGQLGNGTNTNTPAPEQTFENADIESVAAGDNHSLVLTEDGDVFAFGDNSYGQLGDGTRTRRTAPVKVSLGVKAKAVSTGNSHSLAAVKEDQGGVMSWGLNNNGQLGDGTTTQRIDPVFLLDKVLCRTVSAGDNHSLALTENGEVFSWGLNNNGQLGDGTTTRSLVPLKIKDFVDLKLSIIAIAAGGNHSMALTSEGRVWVWGDNNYGQLGDETKTDRSRPVVVRGLEGVVAIAAGQNHCLALLDDGRVFGWGYNNYNQVAEKEHGTTILTPVEITVLDTKGICAIFSGSKSDHSFAVASDGTVWSWGQNNYGQASDSDINGGTISVPKQVEGLEGIGSAAAGLGHSLATSRKRGAIVQVLDATTEWMPMDVHVEAGETWTIDAAGQWKVNKEDSYSTDANGFDNYTVQGTALETANLGSLIGRIGLNGTPFFVGMHFEQVIEESGTLYLQMNDTPGYGMADNEGELEISMQKVNG